MNRKIAEKWMDALRSGEYAQCTGALNAPGEGHCCFGVLCELAVDDGVPVETMEKVLHNGRRIVGYDGHVDVPPPAVQDWAEVLSQSGELDQYHEVFGDDLVQWNDNGATFAEIADMIETEWETL